MQIKIQRSLVCGILVFFILYSPASFNNLQSLFAQSASKEEETLFMAKKAFEDGFYEVSLGLLERFLKDYPDSPEAIEANLLIGECYFQQNKFLAALAKFEALFQDPEARNIRDALYYWSAEAHFKGNNFRQAASYYEGLIQGFPASSYVPLAYYSLGWSLFQEQKFQEAREYFQVLIEKYPQEPQAKDAAFKIIECLYNLKDYALLKEKINTALNLFSKDPLSAAYLYFYLGEAHYYLGDFNLAQDAYSRSLAQEPDQRLQALVKLDLAWTYLKLKRYPEAEDIFRKLKQEDLEKRSQDILLLGKATLMMETNRVQQAKKLYEQLLGEAGDPTVLAQAYIGKADALYNLADYTQASQAYRQALAQVKSESLPAEIIERMYYNLSCALSKSGCSQEAIQSFQKVIAIGIDKTLKASSLCQIGDIYQELGDYQKAQEVYRAVLKDYPDAGYGDYAYYQLGAVFIKGSDYAGAIANLNSLLKNFPTSRFIADAIYSLGLAYFKNQDYALSQKFLGRFRKEFLESDLRPKALYLLGDSFCGLGDYASARDIFKETLRVASQDIELTQKAEYAIADCYYRLGQEQEALSRFKSLRTKYPGSLFTAEVIWWLGSYYYQCEDLALARRYFLSIIQDFPASDLVADAYYALGLTFVEDTHAPEALENFRKALAFNNAKIKPLASLAMADIYVKESKYDLALQLYRNVLIDYSDMGNLIYPKLAAAFAKTGDSLGALEYYRQALATAPLIEKSGLLMKVAEIQETLGMFKEAVEGYLEAVDLARQDNALAVKAFLRIAQIYEDKDDLEQALNFYNRILKLDTPESKFARERINLIKSGVK